MAAGDRRAGSRSAAARRCRDRQVAPRAGLHVERRGHAALRAPVSFVRLSRAQSAVPGHPSRSRRAGLATRRFRRNPARKTAGVLRPASPVDVRRFAAAGFAAVVARSCGLPADTDERRAAQAADVADAAEDRAGTGGRTALADGRGRSSPDRPDDDGTADDACRSGADCAPLRALHRTPGFRSALAAALACDVVDADPTQPAANRNDDRPRSGWLPVADRCGSSRSWPRRMVCRCSSRS